MGDVEPDPEPENSLSETGRPQRTRMVPKRLHDYLPSRSETLKMTQYAALRPP